MMDVVLNKKERIERCIRQINIYYRMSSDKPFEKDYFKQDAIAANLQRAAEQAIDLANHVIKKRKLGLPKESWESFLILAREHVIPIELAEKLKGMVGFRNILVHEYQDIDIKIMVDVIEHHLDDLIVFTNHVMEYMRGHTS
ncbi:MAG: DUF86 domain-containing protein [Methanosarcinales archaeon]|nr:MAG: DUF86 domain-containing protein [Methanosarcinales archaeon]